MTGSKECPIKTIVNFNINTHTDYIFKQTY